jgi:predicted RNase H-like HicB family nuclease
MTAHPTGSTELAHGKPPAAVPVFNCIVHVAPRNADGIVVARVVNLAGIEVQGRSEREALTQAVAAFKAAVAGYHAQGESMPFVAHQGKPAPGETERLIAVHL